MRILVVSDIHANWPALQAIREEADAVVCLGDLVSYGPFPQECVAWVRERAAHVIRGMGLSGEVGEALINILRTGKPRIRLRSGSERSARGEAAALLSVCVPPSRRLWPSPDDAAGGGRPARGGR
jgi:hypothetical protein